ATRPEDMIRSRYTDWLASVEDGYHLLSGVAPRVYLAGLSMGGVLSLLAASYLPVRGVIAMATPYNLPEDWRVRHTGLLSRIQPYMPKSKEPPGAGWFDAEAWKEHISYPQNPVRSIGELKQLLDAMRAALPKVTVPVLLVYSKNDHYLPLGSLNSMNYIYEHVGTTDRQKVVVERSGHVLTRD
ncbi:MAG: alpha/beta fold hydrolase, partial [Anaerolineales bacterium]